MSVFCTNCQCEVGYCVVEEKSKKIIKGYEVEYKKKSAHCERCEHPVFVEQLHEENEQEAKRGYQELVSSEAIRIITAIMEQYNIGKRPLSLILDWGELTITRYLKGMAPKKEYLDTLKLIHRDVAAFAEILEKNQDKITKKAYEKCQKRMNEWAKSSDEQIEPFVVGGAEKLELDEEQVPFAEHYFPTVTAGEEELKEHEVSDDKIYQVVHYILDVSEDVTPNALQKILYYAQAFFKVFYGYHLFEDDCEAWAQGPVYPKVYDRLKESYQHPVIQTVCPLDDQEQFFIDLIMRYFGCYSGKSLERMTHCEKPWREARHGLVSVQVEGRVMEKSSIEQYFTDVYKKYNMLSMTDIIDYSTSLFSRIL